MKFLVAVDGSEHSVRALEFALELAEPLDAEMTLVHAAGPRVRADPVSGPVPGLSEAEQSLTLTSLEEAEQRGERVLEDAAERLADAGVTVQTELLVGNPVEAIPEYAEENGFDAVYVGHRGLSDRYEGLVGSVAKELVGRCSMPVTVVR